MDTAETIIWDHKYDTGIAMIDDQHKELLQLINELHQACVSGQGVGDVFTGAMHRMVEYVHFHFGAEQQLLSKVKYPDYHEHKKQHDALIKNILDAAKDYSEGKRFVPNNFVRTLKEWVFGHIAVSDKHYASYIMDQKKKGLLSLSE